ncbi:pyrroloquinoline quinone precursor peptide PqqA [Solimonas variicoloris]|nr:pyrroloquinoline quinone precursor peptide PqqA [Solimonas variicoloris]
MPAPPNATGHEFQANDDETRRFSMWTKPSFRDLRFGMEITMYILNRQA